MHYLDNASTTAVQPLVADLVCETLTAHFANPSSLYEPGFDAQRMIDDARTQLAQCLGCADKEVVFCGSGTEANNIAILGEAFARRNWANHLVATGYEHPSAAKPLQLLAKEFGFGLTLINPGEDGRVDIDALVGAAGKKTALVCAMHVNNETGAVLDVAALARRVKEKNSRTAVHVDGVQAFCKQPLVLRDTGIDSYAVSGHKLRAPKGVGALYLRQGLHITPPFTGGGQERGLRPGTENTANIAGFGLAATMARQFGEKNAANVKGLQAQLMAGLRGLEDITINSPADAQPGIVNFSLPGVRSETMLHFLEQRDVYVSAGSACSRGEPSHTLTAMGLKPQQVTSALRVSIGPDNTAQDINALLEGLDAGLKTLARGRVGER